MIPAGLAAWFAKPAVKWGGLLAIGVALVVGTALYIQTIRNDGKKAGGAEVTTKVQGETIRQIEKARTDKEKTDAKDRSTPLDDLIDRSLR